jgi:hypothetical protein
MQMQTTSGWIKCLLMFALAVTLSACGRDPGVSRYSAPKEFETDDTPAIGDTDQSDRMLAVLVPHGDAAWFFKLAGPKDQIDAQAETFETFVKSVHFADGAEATPEWTLPSGWAKSPKAVQMRFATLTIGEGEKPLEVSVSQLPWPPKAFVTKLHENVNRWRKQMQLKLIPADELPDQFRELKVAGGDAYFVDLKGKQGTDTMRPQFASTAMDSGKMPAGHPPVAPSEKAMFAAADEPAKQVEPAKKAAEVKLSADAKAVAPPTLPFEYKMPEDWTPTTKPMFAEAAFKTKQADAPVMVSVTPMSGPGGDIAMNVNRWRGQLKQEPLSADDLASTVPASKIAGREGRMVKVVGTNQANQPAAITAAMVKDGDKTWIFRMSGSPEAVEKQAETFEKFLGSIKFGEGK